jgi:MFS family permease
VFFGWLSDKIGRKPIILTGCALAALTYFPLFHALTAAANPALAEAQASAPVTVVADPASCSVQFDPVGKTKFDKSGCDIAKSALAKAGIPYANQTTPGDTVVRIGALQMGVTDKASFDAALPAALAEAGYPAAGETPHLNRPLVVAILTALVLLVTMVYGPIAALLVELFPSRIRYTALSLPYHIGNGWFGGFLPTIAFAIVAATGDIYAGLWYPVGVALMTLVIGLLFLPETFRRRIDHAH